MIDWQKRGPVVRTRRERRLSPYVVERILDRSVAGPNGCILWTGAKFTSGHGKIKAGGHGMLRVHRVILEAYRGPLDEGLLACHACDVPNCVNPLHLFAGTIHDNNKDCVRKGRHAFGSKNGQAKLNEAKIRHMKDMVERGASMTAAAKKVGVSQSTAWSALNGATWSHLKGAGDE